MYTLQMKISNWLLVSSSLDSPIQFTLVASALGN
jgi:hypothetical protein